MLKHNINLRHVDRSFIIHFITITVGMFIGVLLADVYLTPHFYPITTANRNDSAKPRHAIVKWHTNHTVADHLRKEIRILCWIMTGPAGHLTKAQHVRHTWGKHCNTLLFMTSVEDPVLPNSIPLSVNEGRNNLWAKTKESLKYVYDNHLDDADWFLKADDDTYVVMENLRQMLHPYSPATPIYIGHKFQLPADKSIYMSGGSGYVLSKAALRTFIEDGIPNPKLCSAANNGAEDVQLGRCMKNLNVLAGDDRDDVGRHRFYPLPMDYTMLPRARTFWYYKYSYYYPIEGETGVPPNAVSFHYTKPKWMYIMDYLLYDVQTHGLAELTPPIDEYKFSTDEVMRHLADSKPSNLTASLV